MPAKSVKEETKDVNLHGSLRVLALAGSLRTRSYNHALLEAAREHAPRSIQFSLYEELASIPLFSEDLESNGFPESVEKLRRQVADSDGLVIATPEYNHSMPGVLKNVVDWLSRPGSETVLERKPVALMGATTGAWGTRYAQSALRQVLYATESLVLPSPSLFVRQAPSLFDRDGRLVDTKTILALERLLTAFGEWIFVHRQAA